MEIDIKSKRKTEVTLPPPQVSKSPNIPDVPKPKEIAPVKGSANPIIIFIIFVIGIVGGLIWLTIIVDSSHSQSDELSNTTELTDDYNAMSYVEEVVVADSDPAAEHSYVSNIEIPSHSNISVWKEYNDYNREETNCYWLVNPTRKTVDYVAYFSSSESQVLHSFKFYTTTWKKFKKAHPGVRLYLNQKDRIPYSMTNSTTILVSGPHENESETWGYPVYTIMLPNMDKTYVFINSPDGEKTYLSYAILKKLNN